MVKILEIGGDTSNGYDIDSQEKRLVRPLIRMWLIIAHFLADGIIDLY